MTSANFRSIPIDSITIEREARQRREITGIVDLRSSINDNGLINPILVTPDHVLVTGERRLTACRELGWTNIPVQYTTDLSRAELYRIELEENIRREDITWPDKARAISAYHALCADSDPEWTQEKTAANLYMTGGAVSKYLMLDEALDDPKLNKSIADIKMSGTAANVVRRQQERKASAVIDELVPDLQLGDEFGTGAETVEFKARGKLEEESKYFLNADFIAWTHEYRGQPFNLIHCDFPYGVGMQKDVNKGKQNIAAARALGSYEDTEDTYDELLAALAQSMDNVVSHSAHLVFWFATKTYTKTFETLTEMGWKVNPIPLVWGKSDNKGLLSDPQRSFRHVYETAFLASRGDRKIVRSTADLIHCASVQDRDHLSEKSSIALGHFLAPLVDSSTRLLDPTCGAGGAVYQALKQGASYALGIEKEQAYYERALANYEQYQTVIEQ